MKIAWTWVKQAWQETWEGFIANLKNFSKGSWIKVGVDLFIAAVIAALFPVVAIAFASANFISAKNELFGIVIAISIGVLLGYLWVWIPFVVTFLAALFISCHTSKYVSQVREAFKAQAEPA